MAECCHCHHQEHSSEIKKKGHLLTNLKYRLILGMLTLAISYFLPRNISILVCILSYLILGYDILFITIKNILKGRFFDEQFLMSIATFGALVLGEYTEACAIFLFYQIGETLSHKASKKAEKSISELIDTRPEKATLITADGLLEVLSKDLVVGDRILVGAGGQIVADGKVAKGSALVDTSSFSGEIEPKTVKEGDTVLAGMVVLDSSIEIDVLKEYSNSALSKIISIANEAKKEKSKAQNFITSFAKVYTPIVVAIAVIITLLYFFLPFLDGVFGIKIALKFLVISCPCALIVSIPVSFFTGMANSSKKGILVKNTRTLENLSSIKTAVFDKTGTLTNPFATIEEINTKIDESIFIKYLAHAESTSSHPIAKAIIDLYKERSKEEINPNFCEEIKEVAGKGVICKIEEKEVIVGKREFLKENSIACPPQKENAIYAAIDKIFAGFIICSFSIKPEAKNTISRLKRMGITSCILSGDNKVNTEKIANELNITKYYSDLLPQEKTEIINELKKTGEVLFVGDGINDAPSLAFASVGMSMGIAGSDASIEASDAVIMKDDLTDIVYSIILAKKVMRIVRQNIALSIGIKILVMVLSFMNIGGFWPAVFADTGMCIITVLNAFRLYFPIRNKKIR